MALQGVARVGDSLSGHCNSHSGGGRNWTGTFSTGSAGFKVDGQNAVCVGDTGPTSCGHTFRVSSGSTVLTGAGGVVVARHGDAVVVVQGGTGVILSGSPTTKAL